jgi:hypothetical protein
MCELLVMVRDTGGTPAHQCLRRGDVVVAAPDGWRWSHAELHGHPEWCVLRVTGMTLEEGEALTVAEPGDGRPRHLRNLKAFHLDLDAADAHETVKAIADRTSRGENVSIEVIDAAHVRPLRRRKPRIPDRTILGGFPRDRSVLE